MDLLTLVAHHVDEVAAALLSLALRETWLRDYAGGAFGVDAGSNTGKGRRLWRELAGIRRTVAFRGPWFGTARFEAEGGAPLVRALLARGWRYTSLPGVGSGGKFCADLAPPREALAARWEELEAAWWQSAADNASAVAKAACNETYANLDAYRSCSFSGQTGRIVVSTYTVSQLQAEGWQRVQVSPGAQAIDEGLVALMTPPARVCETCPKLVSCTLSRAL